MKKAVLFVNHLKKDANELAENIKTNLKKYDFEAVVYLFKGKPDKPPVDNWDIAFSLGGDGTVLYTARSLASLGVPILPINLGSLGFLAEVNSSDWLDIFLQWLNGGINLSRRCMFEITVERNSKIIMDNMCLNDAVVSYTGRAKLIKLNVQITPSPSTPMIESTLVTLGSYRCDGLIIATPTGSTAYSMAAGGPILDPEMAAIIINPICPFTLSNRAFVLPLNQAVVVKVAEEQRSNVLLTIDGQDTFDLECSDTVIVKQAASFVNLIFPNKHAYYSALRKKLFWVGDS